MELLFFPSYCAVSSEVESMKISKSGINKTFQELNKVKAVAAAGRDKDNFHAWQEGVAEAPKSFPSACAMVVPWLGPCSISCDSGS